MKLKVRTLNNTEIEIEVDPKEQLIDVKKKIESVMSHLSAERQMLIHQGKILNDANKLSDYEAIKDGDKLVVMIPKAKQSATTPQTPTPGTEVSTEQSTAAAPPVPSPVVTSVSAPSNEAVTAVQTNTTTVPAESQLVVGEELENIISNICGMGFERNQVERALQAAYNNPDRAVEYLMTGLPTESHLNADHSSTAPQSQTGEDQLGHEGQPGGNNLDIIRQHPQFEQIRMAIQSNPQVLPTILQIINRQHPELGQLILDNQAEFLRLMEEGAPPGRPSTITIQVTPEQREKVRQLESLGFSEVDAIEALEACDWDENAAADFLLSYSQEADEEDELHMG